MIVETKVADTTHTIKTTSPAKYLHSKTIAPDVKIHNKKTPNLLHVEGSHFHIGLF